MGDTDETALALLDHLRLPTVLSFLLLLLVLLFLLLIKISITLDICIAYSYQLTQLFYNDNDRIYIHTNRLRHTEIPLPDTEGSEPALALFGSPLPPALLL